MNARVTISHQELVLDVDKDLTIGRAAGPMLKALEFGIKNKSASKYLVQEKRGMILKSSPRELVINAGGQPLHIRRPSNPEKRAAFKQITRVDDGRFMFEQPDQTFVIKDYYYYVYSIPKAGNPQETETVIVKCPTASPKTAPRASKLEK